MLSNYIEMCIKMLVLEMLIAGIRSEKNVSVISAVSYQISKIFELKIVNIFLPSISTTTYALVEKKENLYFVMHS